MGVVALKGGVSVLGWLAPTNAWPSWALVCYVALRELHAACTSQINRPYTPALPRPAALPVSCRRVLNKWISRFDLWPYLERYTIDATREVLGELGGKPDFIIGNYRCDRWGGGLDGLWGM